MMRSMLHAPLALVIDSDAVGAIAPLLLFLSLLGVVLIWNRRGRSRRKPNVLIRVVAEPGGSGTRPSLMNAESEAIAGKIDRIVEGAGLGPVKVLLFQGEPTTDFVVETDQPDVTARRLQTLLVGLPVAITTVGRRGGSQVAYEALAAPLAHDGETSARALVGSVDDRRGALEEAASYQPFRKVDNRRATLLLSFPHMTTATTTRYSYYGYYAG